MGTGINRLLNQIENKELVLPEFQREYEWSKSQAKLLIDSFLKGFPTGSLLFWKTQKVPAIKNMPNFDPDSRVSVLLDGQQRLTVLYCLLKGKAPPFYSKIDKDPRDLCYNLETRELKYQKRSMKNDPRWVEITSCFNGQEKINPFEKAKKITDNEKDAFEKAEVLKSNLDDLKSISTDPYPIMYIKEDANLQHALTVFDRVNSQGSPLSDADIALAHMCSTWSETRREFKKKLEQLEDEGFEFDLKFLTRGLNAVINCRAEYDQLHDVSEEELKDGWSELSDILNYVINIMKDHAYIYSTDDLNTPNVLIPIIAHLSLTENSGFGKKERDKILYWMYAALFLRRYSGSVTSNLRQDLRSLKEKKPLRGLIATLKEEEGGPQITQNNLDSRGVRHPLYNMMCIVIRSQQGVDWANGIKLNEPYGENYQIQRHHIFPKSILDDAGYDTGESLYDKKRVNEIANRVPLTQSGNLEIFDQPPSKYLPKVKEEHPGTLKAHMIPQEEDFWEVKNYEEFLKKRRKKIAEGINNFMKKLIKGTEIKNNDSNN